MRLLLFVLPARAPGTKDKGDVLCTHGAVAIDITLRILGTPCTEDHGEVWCFDASDTVNISSTIGTPWIVDVATQVDK